MIATEATLFGRLLTAMVTPFDDNDKNNKIDYQSVEKIVNHLIATGTDSIVVAGTTGESPTLSDDEKIELIKAVKTTAAGRAKVIVGSGSNVTNKSVEATVKAEKLGADGVLVVAPYYNKPNQDGLFAHFQAIANSTSLPVIIYNIPGRTGINIASDTILKLTKTLPNIYALKDSTGNTDQSAEIAGCASKTFRIYSGDDYLTLPFLSIGACGVISVASHIVGQPIKNMMESFFAGNIDDARQIHYRYLSLFKGLFNAPNPHLHKICAFSIGFMQTQLALAISKSGQ